MLINAVKPEEVRIAIISDSRLEDFQVEVADHRLTRGNIYRGTIVNIEPSLNAAFIDYGGGRHGFLAIQDVVPEAYYREPKGDRRARIEEVLERGRPIVVQVQKEAEDGKGAVLTTDLSLPGRYLVLTPFNANRGISRKVEDEETRRALRDHAAKLQVPPGSGFIVRTNALDQTKADLGRDLAALLRLWKQIGAAARKGKGIQLLYSDQDIVLRALRDYLDSSVEEILVDDDEAFARAQEYLRAFLPRGRARLVRYTERTPLFARFDLEPQIDRIFERRVALPSGGSIVIDRTEALTAIDVNSGRSRRAASQEETATHTNLEAAQEVARQLQLRDIGGLVVVDFIDMRGAKNRRKVEKALREAMKADKARSSVGRISANGLLEVNRQRIQQTLLLRTHRTCPTCDGTGRIPSAEMVGLNLLRRIEARAAAGSLGRARVELHPEFADALQNGRRQEIAALEREFGIRVEIIASPSLHRSEQEVAWFDREPGEARPARAPAAPVQAAQLAAADAAPPEPAAPPKPAEKRSRKRRRRRKPRAGTAAGGSAEAGSGPQAAGGEGRRARTAAAGEAPAPSSPAPGGTAKKRRPRRRRRKKAGNDGSGPAA